MVRNLAANSFMSFFVAANGRKKWPAFPAGQWGESCWNSAWEVSKTERKGPPGAAAWATSKQAKVRHKHSLSKSWPGFLCTKLNLGLAREHTSRVVFLGINWKVQVAGWGGGVHFAAEEVKAVSVTSRKLSAWNVLGKKINQSTFCDLCIYKAVCLKFQFSRHFCYKSFKRNFKVFWNEQ